MAFTTPVPLPSPAQLPTPQRGHIQAPAQANKLHQGFSFVKGANAQQTSSDSQSRSGTASQHRDTGPAQTGTCTTVSGKQTLVCSAAPASATDPDRMDSTSQVGTPPHRMPCQGSDTSAQPSQLVHTCGMPDEGQASAGQGTKEGIAEVLTGHLHAWGKTLQKMRRPGRCLPEEGHARARHAAAGEGLHWAAHRARPGQVHPSSYLHLHPEAIACRKATWQCSGILRPSHGQDMHTLLTFLLCLELDPFVRLYLVIPRWLL